MKQGRLLPGNKIVPERIRENREPYYAALQAAIAGAAYGTGLTGRCKENDLIRWDVWGLVNEKVDVLGHEDVGDWFAYMRRAL